jgi:hypothetical protein
MEGLGRMLELASAEVLLDEEMRRYTIKVVARGVVLNIDDF